MNYSPEYKEAMLRRMLPPNNESIKKIAKEEGLSEQTLRNWRDKARKEGYAAPGKDSTPDDWNTQDKPDPKAGLSNHSIMSRDYLHHS